MLNMMNSNVKASMCDVEARNINNLGSGRKDFVYQSCSEYALVVFLLSKLVVWKEGACYIGTLRL